MKKIVWGSGASIAVVVAIIVALLCITKYNTLSVNDEAVDTAWSPLSSIMQTRYDIIPKVVSSVVRYTGKRDDDVKKLTATYNKFKSASGIVDRVNAANEIEGAYTKLFIQASQRYPGITSNYQVQSQQKIFDGTEKQLVGAAGAYYDAVQKYNSYSRKFPTNLVALILRFPMTYPYFKREG
jgi:LemA protein